MGKIRKRNKHLDYIARHNKEAWEELSKAGIGYSKPLLDLTEDSAWSLINRDGVDIEVRGRDVLCLASGGGQQSAAFGILGANVTVFDLSESMLKKDVETAKHFGFPIRVEQGDMRDLSIFEDGSFDIVHLSFAINFVPNIDPVMSEVSRVLREKGYFHTQFSNPYFLGVYDKYDRPYQKGTLDWEGYAVTEPYIEGVEIVGPDPFWDVWPSDDEDDVIRVKAPKEFRHTFSTVLNQVVENDLRLIGLWEHHTDYDSDELGENPDPGSWHHFASLIPTMISIWVQKDTC